VSVESLKANEKLPDVAELMIRTEAGTPKALLANAITALRFDPAWWGVLAFNEFSLYAVTKKITPWQKPAGNIWTDHDDSLAANWLQHNGILVSSKVAGEAVQTVARDNSFHPVRDYVNALLWDGRERLDLWLTSYLGAENTPFIRTVGARWLVSAIARIFQPGCQVDHTLLLEGPQGIRKSSALRVLVGDERFADHLSELGSKDSRIELSGKWVIEIGELDRVRRGELERVKAFLSARTDHFRVPYARRAEDVPRSCVFAASTNDQTPFTDETGNRRFWPVRCGQIQVERLTEDRDQLWAEAYARYKQHPVWWLDSEELNAAAMREQEQRYDSGVWDEVILDWLDDPKQRDETDGGAQLPIEPFDSDCTRVTITDILIHAVGKPLDRCTQADRNQVARCLIHAGWQRKQERKRGPNRGKWFYFRGEETTAE
jgi:putative DNA primase/helicase